MSLPANELRMLEKHELVQRDVEYFKAKYGKRFVKALRAVEEEKVFLYHFLPSDTNTWIVKGKRREYLIIPKIYCTCRSFYQDVVISRETQMCYHLLAQTIAELRGQYNVVETTDVERRKLYVGWRRTD